MEQDYISICKENEGRVDAGIHELEGDRDCQCGWL